jgi:FKBP-type peptidyl-prolyl cis-trans isomerase SlyD
MFDAQGNLLEHTDEPLVYLHGAGDIFPRIEALLEGQEAGFSGSLLLQPEEAFGEFDADHVHLLRVEELGSNVAIGLRYEGLPGRTDGRTYLVTDLADGFAVLDGNHPLAGRALRFDVQVVAVLDDAQDEADDDRTPSFDLRPGPGPALQ